MRTKRSTHETLEICFWILTSFAVVATITWIDYTAYHVGKWIVLVAAGSLLCIIGLTVSRSLDLDRQARKSLALESSSLSLKGFRLNGRYFQPYEQEIPGGGRQFRLYSTMSISEDVEAALIRYLINEGLSETLWPQISERLEAESRWAFLA
jgi:hypothetical protein